MEWNHSVCQDGVRDNVTACHWRHSSVSTSSMYDHRHPKSTGIQSVSCGTSKHRLSPTYHSVTSWSETLHSWKPCREALWEMQILRWQPFMWSKRWWLPTMRWLSKVGGVNVQRWKSSSWLKTDIQTKLWSLQVGPCSFSEVGEAYRNGCVRWESLGAIRTSRVAKISNFVTSLVFCCSRLTIFPVRLPTTSIKSFNLFLNVSLRMALLSFFFLSWVISRQSIPTGCVMICVGLRNSWKSFDNWMWSDRNYIK